MYASLVAILCALRSARSSSLQLAASYHAQNVAAALCQCPHAPPIRTGARPRISLPTTAPPHPLAPCRTSSITAAHAVCASCLPAPTAALATTAALTAREPVYYAPPVTATHEPQVLHEPTCTHPTRTHPSLEVVAEPSWPLAGLSACTSRNNAKEERGSASERDGLLAGEVCLHVSSVGTSADPRQFLSTVVCHPTSGCRGVAAEGLGCRDCHQSARRAKTCIGLRGCRCRAANRSSCPPAARAKQEGRQEELEWRRRKKR